MKDKWIRKVCGFFGTVWTILIAIAVLSTGATGCYYRREVETSQVGLLSPDGVTVSEVVGAGRYSDGHWYAEIHKLDASAKTIQWDDPDLVTKDKQPIGLQVSVTYRRPNITNPEAVQHLWNTYRTEAKDDEALSAFVLNRIPRAAKAITTKYTLDEMLGITGDVGREIVTKELRLALEEELSEAGIPVLDVGINNIQPDEAYLQLLKDKANSQAELELATARTLQLREQVKQEEAQTDISLEIAKRENRVAEEKAKVFELSDRAYELERLARLGNIIGGNDKMFFVPEGTDITLLLGEGAVLPVK